MNLWVQSTWCSLKINLMLKEDLSVMASSILFPTVEDWWDFSWAFLFFRLLRSCIICCTFCINWFAICVHRTIEFMFWNSEVFWSEKKVFFHFCCTWLFLVEIKCCKVIGVIYLKCELIELIQRIFCKIKSFHFLSKSQYTNSDKITTWNAQTLKETTLDKN